jgi:multicomponent Na+:H+ antiporter subunit F
MKQPDELPAHSKNIWRELLAEGILIAAAALIFCGIVFGVLRLILGRTLVDRVVAVDMLTVISISLIALYAHVAGRLIYLDVALVYGVLSFLAVLAVARYLERGI